ncbi:hypothetical protein HK101_004716 [Irineochytrium annulatum]|nr:hypothetical protein HK101_004716 [Irineochytrium annulatum]
MQATAGPTAVLVYDPASKQILTQKPSDAQSTWTPAQLRRDAHAALERAFLDAQVHPDRLRYAFLSRVFIVQAPRPLGGRRKPGFLSFSGDTADDAVDWVLELACAASPARRGRGQNRLLGFVVDALNEVLALHHEHKDKDALDDAVLKGMRRSAHLVQGDRFVLPEHLRDSFRKANAREGASVRSGAAGSSSAVPIVTVAIGEMATTSRDRGRIMQRMDDEDLEGDNEDEDEENEPDEDDYVDEYELEDREKEERVRGRRDRAEADEDREHEEDDGDVYASGRSSRRSARSARQSPTTKRRKTPSDPQGIVGLRRSKRLKKADELDEDEGEVEGSEDLPAGGFLTNSRRESEEMEVPGGPERTLLGEYPPTSQSAFHPVRPSFDGHDREAGAGAFAGPATYHHQPMRTFKVDPTPLHEPSALPSTTSSPRAVRQRVDNVSASSIIPPSPFRDPPALPAPTNAGDGSQHMADQDFHGFPHLPLNPFHEDPSFPANLPHQDASWNPEQQPAVATTDFIVSSTAAQGSPPVISAHPQASSWSLSHQRNHLPLPGTSPRTLPPIPPPPRSLTAHHTPLTPLTTLDAALDEIRRLRAMLDESVDRELGWTRREVVLLSELRDRDRAAAAAAAMPPASGSDQPGPAQPPPSAPRPRGRPKGARGRPRGARGVSRARAAVAAAVANRRAEPSPQQQPLQQPVFEPPPPVPPPHAYAYAGFYGPQGQGAGFYGGGPPGPGYGGYGGGPSGPGYYERGWGGHEGGMFGGPQEQGGWGSGGGAGSVVGGPEQGGWGGPGSGGGGGPPEHGGWGGPGSSGGGPPDG